MNWLGLLLLGAGLFAVAGAALDWDWFMNHPKARLFVNLFGRAGAPGCSTFCWACSWPPWEVGSCRD